MVVMDEQSTGKVETRRCFCMELTYTVNAHNGFPQLLGDHNTPSDETAFSLWLPQRATDQAYTLLRHASRSSPVLSHTDNQISIRLLQTVDPSLPLSFDDLRHHSYRLGNPQPAPHQHYGSGNLDLHTF